MLSVEPVKNACPPALISKLFRLNVPGPCKFPSENTDAFVAAVRVAPAETVIVPLAFISELEVSVPVVMFRNVPLPRVMLPKVALPATIKVVFVVGILT